MIVSTLLDEKILEFANLKKQPLPNIALFEISIFYVDMMERPMSGLSVVTKATSLGLLHHKNEENSGLLIHDRECISLHGRLETVRYIPALATSSALTIPSWCFLYVSAVESFPLRSAVLCLKALKNVMATIKCSFGFLGRIDCEPDLL